MIYLEVPYTSNMNMCPENCINSVQTRLSVQLVPSWFIGFPRSVVFKTLNYRSISKLQMVTQRIGTEQLQSIHMQKTHCVSVKEKWFNVLYRHFVMSMRFSSHKSRKPTLKSLYLAQKFTLRSFVIYLQISTIL